MKRIHRYICFLLAAALLLPMAGIPAKAEEEKAVREKQYRIWFDEEAPQTMKGFEEWSLPIGNGYMGLNVFGGVETELISVTENSLFNPYVDGNATTPGGEERCKSATGGLGLLAKTYIDFGHKNVSNYQRDLNLGDAVASVSYDAEGVHYTREYFSTYPDKVSVMLLSASQSGALSFTLRPIAPYVHDYLNTPGDGMGKTGKTVAEGDTVIVSGMMDWYDINYEGMYKVILQGGTMVATNDENGENGKITVTGADSAVILLAVGTNYHMVPESFVAGNSGVKMDANEYPHEKVLGYMNAAAEKSYEELLAAHRADHKGYFDRASLDLGGVYNPDVTTDQLLQSYKNGVNDPYLEELLFQYGRYLLIASSREGCLPSNLQGIWNFGDTAAWSGGYWHNINVQMNYWPAFNTNLIDLFQSYVDFNETFRSTTEQNADNYLKTVNPEAMEAAGTGANGWAVGTNVSPYRAGAPGTTGHSGPGTGAFTSLLFWVYYDFTRDATILEEHTYPAVEGMASFLSKTLKEYEDGKWLVASSASPENNIGTDPETGKYIYFRTVGTAFDQQMVYENHLVTLMAAERLGYTAADHPLLATLQEQIDHLDPVNVGYSGQVKEYREENYYSDIGDPNHRHISQLVGLYPGTAINGNTDAWLDAARTTLNLRGDGTTGWSICHRLLAWARLMDGERAYRLIERLMTTRTYNNLWTTHPPFQIDSNFGYTAAVAEMLVQSHAGYIEFLPALPSAWATGSFAGLTTRGAFEVDAAWTNGQATKFVLKSNAGEAAAVKYQNIATATVVDSKGNAVPFTKEGTDLIRFATTEGESYTITNISATVKVAAPKGLTMTATGNTMKLTWTAGSNAVSYNVYRAVNDAATYEQVATGITGTSYTYNATDISGADRVTMRVTAVGESGRESVGTLAYSLPVAPPTAATGNMIGTALQLEVSGGTGDGYRVYENGVQVCETPYTVAVVKNADSSKTYTVSTVTEGRESAAIEATIRIAASDNILLGKPLTHSDNVKILSNGKYPLSYAVDGVIETNTSSIKRWAVTELQAPYTVTADLQGTYKLGTFTFWEWLPNEKTTRSDNTKIEVLTPDGQWVTIKSGFALNPGAATNVDMGGVVATQIRMTFENTKAAKSCSITEITCSTLPMDVVDKTELYDILENNPTTGGVKLAQIKAKAPAEAVLQNPDATQAEVDRAAYDVQNAYTKTNIFKKQTITTDAPAYNNNTAKYGAAMMVDENYSTRYAGNDNGPSVTATVTLDGMYHIEAIFVQEYLKKGTLTRGKDVTIEVYDGTKWVTAVSGESLTSTPDTVGGFPATTAFILKESVTGNQVRLCFTNNENKRITIYELQAYGQKVSTTGVRLSASVLNATAGKSVDLTASGTVSSWASSNNTVVSVTDGKLTALAEGTATVTVTGTDGSTASCFITVENDKTPLTDAIAAAKTALEGVSGLDKTPEQVLVGKKFVPAEIFKQLQTALTEAEKALPDANSAQAVQTHTNAINTALTAFNAALQTGTMADNHNHEGVKWIAWGDDVAEMTTLPTTNGHYYLVDNIYPTEHRISAGAEVYLCLNGYHVTCADNNIYSVFGKLHIHDCTDQPGTVSGGDTTDGGTFYVGKTGTLTLHGGIMTASGTAKSGGVAYIAAGGTMEMYGGVITGGNATNYGGNVSNFGTFKLVDGTIEKGSTTGNAGNFYNRGTLEMTGGSICDPAKSFNMLLTTGSTATISGGMLRGNSTYNIRIWDSGVLYVTGGEILSGSFTANGSGIYTDKGGTVHITGGTVSDVAINMIKETEGATNNAKNAASLTIENATVKKLYLADANATYDPQITMAGQAVVENVTAIGVPVTFRALCDGACVTYTKAADGAVFGIGDSVRYIYSDNGLVPVLEGTTLAWGAPKVVTVAQGKQTGHASVQLAVDSESGYVKLLGAVAENVTVSGDVYLDLNGYVLTGNVTGDGTLYGMDSATDSYTTENMGRIEGAVSCTVAGNFKTNITGAVRRYMAIADDSGYTFHRFYMGITHVNLKPSAGGLGYKAVFYGDDLVRQQVAGYGYMLWLGENGKKVSAGKEEAFVSGKTITARLQNFDVAAYGETPVYGQVYLTLKNGDTIESTEYSYTFRNLAEHVDANADRYSENQLNALREMLTRFETTVSNWNIKNIM